MEESEEPNMSMEEPEDIDVSMDEPEGIESMEESPEPELPIELKFAILDSGIRLIIEKNSITNPMKNVPQYIRNLCLVSREFNAFKVSLVNAAKFIALEHFGIDKDLGRLIGINSLDEIFEMFEKVETYINIKSFNESDEFKEDLIQKVKATAHSHFPSLTDETNNYFLLNEESMNDALLNIINNDNLTSDLENQTKVALLLIAGANPNLLVDDLKPIISLAISNKFNNIIQMLILFGADVNLKNQTDWAPVWHAVWARDDKSLKLLLEHGARVNIFRQSNIHHPLTQAIEMGFLNMVKILLEFGAAVNCYNKYSVTPLMRAVRLGFTEIVELLLSYDVILGMRNVNGDTALDIAIALGRTKIANLIRAKIAEQKKASESIKPSDCLIS